mmetsp:Transcript_15258/g.14813  ORF Transcript_15258/g.14813 Transcript_15258/m.14813 type:complete len:131 (-) Transcript_15258:1392-1784(-)
MKKTFFSFFSENINSLLILIDHFERETLFEARENVIRLLIEIGKTNDNKVCLATGQVLLGDLLNQQKRTDDAKKELLLAIEILENNPSSLSKNFQAKAYRNLSAIERDAGNIQNSLEYLELCLEASNEKE